MMVTVEEEDMTSHLGLTTTQLPAAMAGNMGASDN